MMIWSRWPHWRGWAFWMLGLFRRSHQQNAPLDCVLHMRKKKNQVFDLSKSNNRVTTAWDEKQYNIADCGVTRRGWWLNWGVYFGPLGEYQGASELIARTRRPVLTLSFHTHCPEPCCRNGLVRILPCHKCPCHIQILEKTGNIESICHDHSYDQEHATSVPKCKCNHCCY